MTNQTEDDFLDSLEDEPVFICSQLRVGETLTQREVDAIQALLSENDKLENADTDTFQNGRLFGIREVGGDDLVAAVERKDEAYITKTVRITMDKIFAKTREIEASTPPPLSDQMMGNEPITLDVLRKYFEAMDAGDVPDPALALYSYLLMDGFISKASASGEVRAALSAEVENG